MKGPIELLYAYAPYATFWAFLGAAIWRQFVLIPARKKSGRPAHLSTPPGVALALVFGLSGLAIAHAVPVIAMQTVRRALASPWTTALAETIGLVGAMAVAYGMSYRFWQRLGLYRQGLVSQTSMWIVGMLALLSFSGIAMLTTTRWVSVWYAELMAPYWRSLIALEPNVGMLSALPLPIHIHTLSVFVALSISPLSDLRIRELFPLADALRFFGADATGDTAS